MNEKRHLLAHILNQPLSTTYLAPTLTVQQQELYAALCTRLDQGEPLAYLIGSQEFWSLKLRITPDVLIPRPETELLVETVLAYSAEFQPQKLKVLELGVGSGAISIALKKERPHWEITALDKSPSALAVAQENAKIHQIEIRFLASDWFSCLSTKPGNPTKFEIIISNPPYISEQDPHLQGSISYEPQMALQSGPDGLKDLRIIIQESSNFLTQGGTLFLEHGYDQGPAVQALLKHHGYQKIQTLKDIFGNDRVSLGLLPNSSPTN
jgi:release factor glutamine methyltransferase